MFYYRFQLPRIFSHVWIVKIEELIIVEISSIISLLIKEPNKACSASKFEGCLLSSLLCTDLISFTFK